MKQIKRMKKQKMVIQLYNILIQINEMTDQLQTKMNDLVNKNKDINDYINNV